MCTNCGRAECYGANFLCKNCIRLTRHSITVEEYDNKLKEQDGRCAICRYLFNGDDCIDHDHKTGKFRGLLCGTCNMGLGLFKDSIRNLATAIVYLEDNGLKF